MANLLRSFNDSQLGVVAGTVLHTLGAIAFLGGLVGYLAWHRHLRHGHHHAKVLESSNYLAYLAIVVNLVGGFMRTFQSDHPDLLQFAHSPWVRAIAIKHLFLFAAYGAAIYLFEVSAPRELRAHKAGTLETQPLTGHRVASLLVALGILVAAVLGSLSQVVPLVSGAAAAEPEHQHVGKTLYANATGQLTSTPGAPASGMGSFDVPAGTITLTPTFTWTPSQVTLTLTLTAPDGKDAPAGTVVAPLPGSWTYRVDSTLAFQASWSLSIALPQVPEGLPYVERHLTLAPGSFAEVNVLVGAGEEIHWQYAASADLHFNVHTHEGGTEQEWVSKGGSADAGHYTTASDAEHSYLWQNTGSAVVQLDFIVYGDWILDSTTP